MIIAPVLADSAECSTEEQRWIIHFRYSTSLGLIRYDLHEGIDVND